MRAGDAPQGGIYLHLVRDEKFIDEAFATFNEAAPGSHRFAIIDPPENLAHVKTFEPSRMALASVMRTSFLATLPSYRAIFLHSLTPIARWIVANAPVGVRFVWIGWGADYYHLIRTRDDLLLPESLVIARDLRARHARSRARRRARRLLDSIVHPTKLPDRLNRLRLDQALRRIGPCAPEELRMLSRISLFAPVLPEEHDLIASTRPDFSPRPADWNYGVNAMLRHARREQAPPLGRDILLGNSATPENNHADALSLLVKAKMGGRRVICPLGYGDSDYARRVIALGHERLGEAFVPLTSFVSPPEYADLMRSCSLVIMNHVRQQALGTINAALCNGAKVFLRPENPVYGFMRKHGVRVFAMDTIADHLRPDAPPLSEDDVTHARAMIEAQFGPAALHCKTVALLHACAELR